MPCGARGPLTMAPSQLGIFNALRSAIASARQYSVPCASRCLSTSFGDPPAPLPRRSRSAACNLQPTLGRGTVADFARRKPDEAPSDPRPELFCRPMKTARLPPDAIRATRRLMKQKALAKDISRASFFGRARRSATTIASLAKARRAISAPTIFSSRRHREDGARTTIPLAVVDARLRFHGIGRDFVWADASVMPTITSGNTNTPDRYDRGKGGGR